MRAITSILILLLCAIPFFAFAQSEPYWVPLHRYYHEGLNDHYYVTTQAQRNAAVAAGYEYEGIQCYVSSTIFSNGIAVYRWWSDAKGDHAYTTSSSELTSTYTSEGIVFFVATQSYANSSKSGGNLIPLRRFFLNASNGDHFYVTGQDQATQAQAAGYGEEPSLGYISPSAPVNVTVSTNPTGRQITVDGLLYTAPRTFTAWTTGGNHAIAVNSPQSGASDTQYIFSSWSDGGARSHTVTVPGSSTTYTANFTTQYYLTANTWTSDGSFGGTVQPSSGWYSSGAQVSITATPADGYEFLSWGGNASGTNSSISLTMDGPKSVTARFGKKTVAATVATEPAGREITIDGTTYTAPHEFPAWEVGSNHTLSIASPQIQDSDTRFVFSSWDDGGSQTHAVTVTTSRTSYTATFTLQYKLTASVWADDGGNGGTVALDPPGPWYNANITVSIVATAETGYEFLGWGGDGSGDEQQISLTMNSPKSITARFGRLNRPPVLESIGDKRVSEGEKLEIQLQATDPDGDEIGFSTQGNPASSRLVQGLFTWVPDYDAAGTYNVTFIADDGKVNGTDTESITITVDDAPQPGIILKPTVSSAGPIEVGQIVSIAVNAEGASNLLGAAFSLHYPAELLEPSSYTVGEMMGTATDVVHYWDTSMLNEVQIAVTRTQDQGGVGGNGTVAVVEFLVKEGNGEQISFTLSQTTANDINGLPIIVTTGDAEMFRLTVNSDHGTPEGAGWYPKGVEASWTVASPADEADGIRYIADENSGSAVMDGPKTEIIPWTVQYFLTTEVAPEDGGSIELAPAGFWYNDGAVVAVQATPANGFDFSSWEGNAPDDAGNIIMDGPKQIIARFDEQSPPNPPSNLTATALSYKAIQLAWSADSEPWPEYQIERKTESDAEFSLLKVMDAGSTQYLDQDNVVGLTEYWYRIRGIDATGVSSYSNEANATTHSDLRGDVNNDGTVNITDALIVATYDINPDVVVPNNGAIELGDVNYSDNVSITDALIIATYDIAPDNPNLPAGIAESIFSTLSEP